MSHSSTRSYPRSLPFKPPQDLIAREARLRRWTLLLAVGGIAILSATVIAGFMFTHRMSRLADQAASKPDPPLHSPVDSVSSVIPGKPLATVSAESKQRNPLRSLPPLTNSRDQLLEPLGALVAAHLLQTYLNIGLIADSVEGEVYTVPEAKKWLQMVLEVLDTEDRQLTTLDAAKLDPNDSESLARTRGVAVLLRKQAVALQDYWATGAEDEIKKYHESRQEAWLQLGGMTTTP